jgi:hypothetical protein
MKTKEKGKNQTKSQLTNSHQEISMQTVKKSNQKSFPGVKEKL